jgi:hypothetical protein
METTYTWQSAGDRLTRMTLTRMTLTRMTLRNRGEPAGFPRLAGPLMAASIRHANRKDLRKPRAVLQAR